MKILKITTVSIMGTFCGLALILQIPKVNTVVTQGLINFLVPYDHRVKIGQISGAFPFELDIEKITFSDSKGKWLKISHLTYSWRGVDLLFGKINFDYVHIDKIDLLRFPASRGEGQKEQVGSIPDHFPIINVDDFLVKGFTYQKMVESRVRGSLATSMADDHELELIAYQPSSDEKLFTLNSSILQNQVSLELVAEKDIEQVASIFPEFRDAITHGMVTAYFELSTNRQLTHISGFFTGLIRDLETTHPFLKAAVGRKLEWNLDLNLAPHDAEQQVSAKVNSEAGMVVDCDLSYERQSQKLSGAIEMIFPQVQHYHFFGEKVAGSLIFKGDIENNKLSWQMRGLIFDGRKLESSTGELLFQHLSSKQEIGFQATLKLPGFNPILYGVYYAHEEGWGVKEFRLTDSDIKVVGEIVCQSQLNAKADINIKNLSIFRHFHNFPIKGKLQSQIEIHDGKGIAQAQWDHGTYHLNFQTDIAIDLLNNLKTVKILDLKLIEQQKLLILLRQPWEISLASEKVQANEAHFKVGEGALVIKPITFSNQITGEVQLKKIPLTLLHFIDREAWYQGSIEGLFKWSGSISDPQIMGDIKLEKINIPDEMRKTAKSFDAYLQLERKKQQFHIQLGYSDSLNSKVSLKGKVSASKIFPDLSDNVHLTLEGKYNLAILNGFLNSADRLKGVATLSGTVGGTIRRPLLKGYFKVNDCVYENSSIGLLLRQITIEGQLHDHLITFSKISGKDVAKGAVLGQGNIFLKNITEPQVHLELRLDDLIVANSDFLLIRAGGIIKTYHVDQGNLVIGGEVALQSADVYLADTAPKTKLITLYEKGQEKTQPATSTLKKERESSTIGQLDLRVSIPSKLFIRGYGLNSEWRGKLLISGLLTQPLVGGALNLMHGQIDVAGQTLNLTHGKIKFDPQDIEPNPTLDITVAKQVKDINAMIQLQGSASQPEISFVSMPVLPQEEVISLILFGKSLSSVTADQSLRLAVAVASIKATGGRASITDQIRNAFGLDDIGFQQEERDSESGEEGVSSEYKLRVGKQLTEKVYISLKQGISAEKGTDVSLKYDLSENTKAEIEAGTGPRSNAAGLTWEKRY